MTATASNAPRPPERFQGDFLLPGSPGYEEVRGVYNRAIDARPAAIARCAGVADVRAALRLTRDSGLEVAVRGGGHSIGGWSSNDGGLVIDLGLMRDVDVDAVTRTAWLGGGALAGDVLAATLEHGLVAATGAGSKIGLTGLTMGLGEGYLTLKHGFGCDQVEAFELVTADGSILQVSADERPELFWALRGAGPNFGVVTAMKVRLHAVPEGAVGGVLVFDGDDFEPVTRAAWGLMHSASEHFWPQLIYTVDPDGRRQIRVLPGHTGPADLAERELGELRVAATRPIDDQTHRTSYLELIHELPDAPGRRAWDIACFPFAGDRERQLEVLLERLHATDGDLALGPGRLILLWRTGELPEAGPPGCAPRTPGITMCSMSFWTDPAHDGRERRWVSDVAADLLATGVASEAANTANHVGDVDPERVRRVYGDEAYLRLVALKTQYDPGNVFHRNFNVPPAATSGRLTAASS